MIQGTEQFPRENEYSEVRIYRSSIGESTHIPCKFLAKNSGSSNAYTSTCNTNYYFNVATAALSPALARFAAFFHSPLFSPSCTSRELNAVDSENKKNLQSDVWRIYQVNKHLSKEGHVWRKFGSGNRESLSQAAKSLREKEKMNGSLLRTSLKPISATPSPIPSRTPSPAPSVASHVSDSESDGGFVGRETRRRLVEWWSKEYCSSRMRLCVVGKGKSTLAGSKFVDFVDFSQSRWMIWLI
jgi:insulysin